MGFPGGSVVKNRLPMQETQETQVCTLGWQNLLEEIATYSSIGFNPWVQKFPGEGKGNPLQYSCLENAMDGGPSCPWGLKESDLDNVTCSVYLQCGRPGFNPWVRKIPWRRKWLPRPLFLPGESHGWRSLVGCSPRGCRVEHD